MSGACFGLLANKAERQWPMVNVIKLRAGIAQLDYT